MKKKILFSIVTIILMGCSNKIAPTLTDIPSSTNLPSTATHQKLSINTTLPSITPTNEPTHEPVKIQDKYDIPSWVSVPENTVALTIVTSQNNDFAELQIINLQTAEIFQIPIPPDEIDGFFWLPDGIQLGLLSSERTSIILINIIDGNTIFQPIPLEATRFLNQYNGIFPLFPHNSNPSSKDFFLIQYPHNFSPSFRYLANYNYEGDEDSIEITDIDTGTKSIISNPSDGLYDIGIEWSPTQDILAVLQSYKPTGHHIGTYPGNFLRLYDPTGKILGTYEVNFLNNFRWSPDGKMLLSKASGRENNYPCILEISTSIFQCLIQIEYLHPDNYIIDEFHWSPDSKKIIYPIVKSSEPDINSTICIYNLTYFQDSCIFQKKIEIIFGIANLNISPNGDFIQFLFPSCYLCEMSPPSNIGIISINGETFHDIGPFSIYPNTLRRGWLWRPEINQ